MRGDLLNLLFNLSLGLFKVHIAQLLFGLFYFLEAVVDLVLTLFNFPGQLVFGFAQLGLAFVQLLFHLGQFAVQLLQDDAVQNVDLVLAYGNVNFFLHQAGSRGRGHPVQAFQLGDDLLIDQLGKSGLGPGPRRPPPPP